MTDKSAAPQVAAGEYYSSDRFYSLAGQFATDVI